MKAARFSLLLVPAVLLGCSHSTAAPAPPPTVQARVVRSVLRSAPQAIEITGTLHARETAILSAQMPGHIRAVLVRAGDRVRAGQLLVAIDDAAAQSAVNQAAAGEVAARQQQLAGQAEASLAAETLVRYQILKEQKSVSPQEFDEVQKRSEAAELRVASFAARSDEAKAAVAGARAQLGYASLRAPFAGVVTARMADPGTLAAPGVPLLQIDHDGPLQLDTTIDESLIGSVGLGMKMAVNLEGSEGGSITGTVGEIVPAADPASRSFLVKLDLPAGKDLRAGMYATAEVPGRSKPMILVPQSAVVQRGSMACVYALDANGIAQLRYVTLGGAQGDQIEILSGVAAEETLVDQPGDRDLAGQRIASVPERQR
ncbi:MAG TPA: efflux RND transporter periplasmic adaptor subunit [Acidobacteriaceae bacterium]|jgi:RND family efflux transporter MFP subunit|nr:efflux RND transporter periplasmic adaptor subunit [Acidobacteriaceae bacterium]